MAQVGIPDPSTQAVVAETTTAEGLYRYQLLTALVPTVRVQKRSGDGGWEDTYLVVYSACSCPGYQHRADCRHVPFAIGLHHWWTERQAGHTIDMAAAS